MGEVVTVIRSRLADGAYDAGYEQRAADMLERAKAMPGFVSFKSFAADDGERVSIIHFDSAESQRAWAADAEHRAAQAEGRASFYVEYRIVVADVTRDHAWRERASNA